MRTHYQQLFDIGRAAGTGDEAKIRIFRDCAAFVELRERRFERGDELTRGG